MEIQRTARFDPDVARPRRYLPALARWVQRAGGVAMLVFSLSGAVHADDLRLAVSQGPVSLPIYVAEARGYFEHEGLSANRARGEARRQLRSPLHLSLFMFPKRKCEKPMSKSTR